MKQNIFYLFFIFTMVGCSVTKNNFPKKLSRRELKEAMKYSDWRYIPSMKTIHSSYINTYNYDYKIEKLYKKDN